MKPHKRYIGCYFILIFTLLLCGGCGKTSEGDSTQIQEDMLSSPEGLLTTSQWQNGFQETASMTATEMRYYELRRSEMQSPDIDFAAQEKKEVSFYAWNGRYVLTSARGQGEERYFLNCQKSDLEWKKSVEILTDWQDRPHGYVVCLDAVDEDRIAVLFAEKSSNWSGDVLGYDLLMLNAKGEIQSVLTVTEAYGELGITEDMLGLGSWWCDGDGYQFLLPEKTRLAVVDPQGELKLEKTCDLAAEEVFAAGFHMPDGSVVFSMGSMSGGGTKLIWTEFPAGTEHVLWDDTEIMKKQFTVTPEGIMYYTSRDALMAWNLQTGEEKMIYSFSGTDISPNSMFTGQTCYVTVSGKNELIIYDLEAEKTRALADTPPENEENIICGMISTKGHIMACASIFSHEYDGKMIRCQTYTGSWDDKWMRLSAEVTAGNGPDLMVLTREQMVALQKIGALAPLDDFLEEEAFEAMLSGIREAGSVDGNLYGVASEQAVIVLVTSDVLWPGDSWTVRDILDIYDREEMQGVIYGYGSDPQDSLKILIGGLTGDNPFYDADRGESHFESEDFIRLLEICKQYGNTKGTTTEEAIGLMAEGKYLAVLEWFPDIRLYVQSGELYGDGFHYVGFPGQKDGIGVYNSTDFVAVNQKAEDKEEIAAFLNYLLSDEAQAKVSMGYATRTALENLFWYSEYDGEAHCMYRNSNGMMGELRMKADGTSYIPDYLELIDHAGIEVDDDVVWTIVEEETEGFWNGSKSAEEVARVIDNRVQLYLDEQ